MVKQIPSDDEMVIEPRANGPMPRHVDTQSRGTLTPLSETSFIDKNDKDDLRDVSLQRRPKLT